MIGEVKLWAGDDIPENWLACDGTTYADADYPELGAIISDGLRVDSAHFRVPSLVGRFPLGGVMIGTQGGTDTVTLEVANLPAHHHTDNEPAAELSSVLGALEGVGIGSAASVTGDTGDGEPFSILPTYEQIMFIIRAAL